MSYHASIRRAQEWLRHRVQRGSPAWRVLMAVKAGATAVEARLLRDRWAAAEREFADKVERQAAATPDFFFVQVGAHDGRMDDPISRWIERFHWRGLLIEPQREQFDRLRAHYAPHGDRLAFENVAIDRTESTRLLYRVAPDFVHAPEISGLASFLPDRALATYAAMDRISAESVACVPLSTLLQRHGIQRVDLLQIDAEGYDSVVLETIDFVTHPPCLIQYEHRHLSRSEQRACRRKLEPHGYTLLEGRFDAFAFRTGLETDGR